MLWRPWGAVVMSWGVLARSWRDVGASWRDLGAALGRLGAPTWIQEGPQMVQVGFKMSFEALLTISAIIGSDRCKKRKSKKTDDGTMFLLHVWGLAEASRALDLAI